LRALEGRGSAQFFWLRLPFNWLTIRIRVPPASPSVRARSWRSAGCRADDRRAEHRHVRAAMSILSTSDAVMRWFPRGWLQFPCSSAIQRNGRRIAIGVLNKRLASPRVIPVRCPAGKTG